MRRKIHNKVSIEKGNEVKKKGFTLVELLAVVVIISLIAGIGITIYLNAIKNSKEQATLLAIDSVKSAAELYSKENTGEIKWIYQYDSNGKEESQYICMTVQQLINYGYFNEDFFKKDIYENKLNSNTYIEINRDLNSSNTEVKIRNEDTNSDECEMSAVNHQLHDLKIDQSVSWTDRLNFEFSSKNADDNGKVNYSCYDANDESNTNKYLNDKCVLENLNDDSYYKVRICMSPKQGVTTTLKSTVCNYVSLNTAKFNEPTIEIDDSWKKSKTVTISYDDSTIYNEDGYHYFKSEVAASVTSGSVYSCDNFEDGKNNDCSNNVTSVEANKWYEVDDDTVILKVNTNLEKNIKKKITARIQDETGNYLDSNKNISKIDSKPPVCVSSGGNSNWTKNNVVITGKCDDGKGSGCTNATVTNEITKTALTASPGKVFDNAGNDTTCDAVDVYVDKTAPICTVKGGSSNWINASSNPGYRRITATCSDANSGCATPSFYKDYSADMSITNAGAKGKNSGGEVCDNVGNCTPCSAKQTVKIDKTPPACSVTGGSSSWTNQNVTLKGTCSDGLSKCKSSSIIKTFSTNTNSNQSPGTVYDNAGNSTTCGTAAVKIDKTAPTCTVSGGSSSWTNKNVEVKGTCSDTGGSGCTSTTVSQTFTTNTNSNKSPGTVYDNAGNSKACGTKKVKIDKTAPTVGTITKATSKPSGHGCGSASNSSYYFYFQISDSDSGLDYGGFKWSTTSKINAGNSTNRSGSSHWECIGTSASTKKKLELKYKVCDKAGNCNKKDW